MTKPDDIDEKYIGEAIKVAAQATVGWSSDAGEQATSQMVDTIARAIQNTAKEERKACLKLSTSLAQDLWESAKQHNPGTVERLALLGKSSGALEVRKAIRYREAAQAIRNRGAG